MLSIWLASRWANQRADAAQQEAKKWQDAAVAAQSENSDLKAQNAALQAKVERRRGRRRLRH